VLALDAFCFLLVRLKHVGLIWKNQNVVHGNGDTRTGCPVETGILHLVQYLCNGDHWVLDCQVVNDVTKQDNVLGAALTDHDTFKVGVVPWQELIEHNASQGGLSHPGLALGPAIWELRCLNCFGWTQRSEEHTSELQSRFDLVC